MIKMENQAFFRQRLPNKASCFHVLFLRVWNIPRARLNNVGRVSTVLSVGSHLKLTARSYLAVRSDIFQLYSLFCIILSDGRGRFC